MAKSLKLTIILFAFVAFILVSCGPFGNNESTLPDTRPADFNFVLNYGVLAKNQIDTYQGTYTKDLILDGTATTALALSDQEMAEIYAKMRAIDIMSYPDVFKPASDIHMMPFQSYSLTITANGANKSITWDDESNSNSPQATRLRELFTRIHEIVITKDAYKNLPEASGGYD